MRAQSFPLAIQVPVPTSHWDGQLAADLPAPAGTSVLAVFDGQARAYWNAWGGNCVQLTADDGTVALYSHLLEPGVSGRVRAGQQIGLVGSTGNSTGPHLHFAVGTSINGNLGGTISPADWLWDKAPATPASPDQAPTETSAQLVRASSPHGGGLFLAAALVIVVLSLT